METKIKSYLKLSEAYPKVEIDPKAIKYAEFVAFSREQRNKFAHSIMSGTQEKDN